jgi:environmental stress-induced protein Ves
MIRSVILSSQLRQAPWSGGMTSKIIEFPEGEKRAFRISVARIEKSSPFSGFPGFCRIHMLLSGETKLTIDGEAVHLKGNYPIHTFDGASPCQCELISDSASALNIMHKQEIQATVETLTAPTEFQLKTGRALLKKFKGLKLVCDLFYSIRGVATISFDSSVTKLSTNDTLIIRRQIKDIATTVNIQGNATLAHVQILIPGSLVPA